METKIPVTIGKLEALILANKSLLKLGKVRELDENKLMVSGSMRYGLQRIKINISIIEEDQVMLKIIAEGDDVWEKGASSAINKLMSEIKSNTENAQPETLTNGETLITSKIESDVVEEKSKIETKAEQINTKNDKESSTLDENIEHREIKSPKKSGNKPNNYRYYIGIACFLVVLIYYFKLNRTNERNANETEWTSDYRGTIEVSNQNQLSDDSEKSQIIEKEKIKLVEFEIHTRGDGLNNLFDLEKNQYHFANWYHLTYRKGISPAIVFTSNGREASFSTFEIEKTKEEFIIDPYKKSFNSCDELISFVRYKSYQTLNEEWEEEGIVSKPYDGAAMGDLTSDTWRCSVRWNKVNLNGKPVELDFNCYIDISYSGNISGRPNGGGSINCSDYE